MSDTKENILKTALELFSKYGFDAVSVKDIADRLCITKGALYKHYKDKRDIFNTILKRMEEDDFSRAEQYGVPELTLSEMPDKYRNTPLEKMCVFLEAQFIYWTEDEFASKFRKMITVEQYQNPEMSKLYDMYFSGGPVGYTADVFRESGIADAEEKALEFYAPMCFLTYAYDHAENKKEVLKMLRGHIKEFMQNI